MTRWFAEDPQAIDFLPRLAVLHRVSSHWQAPKHKIRKGELKRDVKTWFVFLPQWCLTISLLFLCTSVDNEVQLFHHPQEFTPANIYCRHSHTSATCFHCTTLSRDFTMSWPTTPVFGHLVLLVIANALSVSSYMSLEAFQLQLVLFGDCNCNLWWSGCKIYTIQTVPASRLSACMHMRSGPINVLVNQGLTPRLGASLIELNVTNTGIDVRFLFRSTSRLLLGTKTRRTFT